MVYQWRFYNEQTLEELVWNHLDILLKLKPLARQLIVCGQICDILAVDQQGQLAIIELKNVEDRYVIPQLTRYYHGMTEERPFASDVNYDLPVRLIAIAPVFHPHNLIDQTFSRLDFELLTFQIATQGQGLSFELRSFNHDLISSLDIPESTRPFLVNLEDENAEFIPIPTLPPKSLSRLLENLSPDQKAYALEIRHTITTFDDRMAELGRTTTTYYSLRKGEKDIYTTKRCAEIISSQPGSRFPRLMLWLPFPRKRKGEDKQYRWFKDTACLGISGKNSWTPDWESRLAIYLDTSRRRPSDYLSIEEYTNLYQRHWASDRVFRCFEDLLTLALEHWLERISELCE